MGRMGEGPGLQRGREGTGVHHRATGGRGRDQGCTGWEGAREIEGWGMARDRCRSG